MAERGDVNKKLSMSLEDVIKSSKPERSERGGRGGHRGGDRRDRNDGGRRFDRNRGGMRRFNRGGDRRDDRRDFRRDDRRDDRRDFRRDDRRDDRGDDRRDRPFQRDGFRGKSDRFDRNNNSRKTFETRSNRKNRVRVENLHFNIGNKDLNDLFSSIGKLTYCQVDWDEIGRSKGSAVVTYETEEDAQRAVKELNEAELDGQVLSVKMMEDENRPGIQRRNDFKKY